MSFLTGTGAELIYSNDSPGTLKTTFTSEAQINDVAGMGPQVVLPVGFFSGYSRKTLKIAGKALVTSTGTPTFQLTVRGGAAGTGGPILGQTIAMTTATSIASPGKLLTFDLDVVLGDSAGSAATPGRGVGLLLSPAGFGAGNSQFEVWGGGASPGTFTNFDPSVANYISVNATCSASSASNGIQLLQLLVFGQN